MRYTIHTLSYFRLWWIPSGRPRSNRTSRRLRRPRCQRMTRTCKQQQLNGVHVSSTWIDEYYTTVSLFWIPTTTPTMETGIFRVFSACVLAFSFVFYSASKAFTCLYILLGIHIYCLHMLVFKHLKYFNLIDLMNKT